MLHSSFDAINHIAGMKDKMKAIIPPPAQVVVPGISKRPIAAINHGSLGSTGHANAECLPLAIFQPEKLMSRSRWRLGLHSIPGLKKFNLCYFKWRSRNIQISLTSKSLVSHQISNPVFPHQSGFELYDLINQTLIAVLNIFRLKNRLSCLILNIPFVWTRILKIMQRIYVEAKNKPK